MPRAASGPPGPRDRLRGTTHPFPVPGMPRFRPGREPGAAQGKGRGTCLPAKHPSPAGCSRQRRLQMRRRSPCRGLGRSRMVRGLAAEDGLKRDLSTRAAAQTGGGVAMLSRPWGRVRPTELIPQPPPASARPSRLVSGVSAVTCPLARRRAVDACIVNGADRGESGADNRSLVGYFLENALKLWIRLQLDEECPTLKLAVEGRNRDLLRGRVRGLALSAKDAVYKGLEITSVSIRSEGVAISEGRAPTQPFGIQATLSMSSPALSRSLSSATLRSVLEPVLDGASWPIVAAVTEGGHISLRDSAGLEYLLGIDAEESDLTLSVESVGSEGMAKTTEFELGQGTRIEALSLADGHLKLSARFVVVP
eukprot:scaffold1717_cov377-Prasinococcus_capsulatus_cf.AAC.5